MYLEDSRFLGTMVMHEAPEDTYEDAEEERTDQDAARQEREDDQDKAIDYIAQKLKRWAWGVQKYISIKFLEDRWKMKVSTKENQTWSFLENFRFPRKLQVWQIYTFLSRSSFIFVQWKVYVHLPNLKQLLDVIFYPVICWKLFSRFYFYHLMQVFFLHTFLSSEIIGK